MNVAQVLIFLSEPKRMDKFLGALNAHCWDEWDCGLSRGLEIFEAEEIALCAKFAGLEMIRMEAEAEEKEKP